MKRLILAMLAGFSLITLTGSAAQTSNKQGGKDASKQAKPINLTFNTPDDEDDPHVTSNGLVIYYAANSKKKFDIMFAHRPSVTRPWSAGEILEDYIRTRADDRPGYAATEGYFPQYFFYATKKDDLKDANFDIYVAQRIDATKAYNSPTPVQAICTADDEMHPWMTIDQRSLYFTRKTKEGLRVYVTTRPQAGIAQGWREPTLVDFPPNFCHATVSRDGATMYLQGPLDDKGRLGLFVSKKTMKGWSAPEPLDMLNNSEGKIGDCSPNLSRDGSLLYFASDRPGGKGGLDVWVVPTMQLKK